MTGGGIIPPMVGRRRDRCWLLVAGALCYQPARPTPAGPRCPDHPNRDPYRKARR